MSGDSMPASAATTEEALLQGVDAGEIARLLTILDSNKPHVAAAPGSAGIE